MIHYIFQVFVFQGLFLIVYELFFKKETFFNYNRFYLLFSSVLALVIPFIEFQAFQSVFNNEFIVALPEVVLGYSDTEIFQKKLNSPELINNLDVTVFNWFSLACLGFAVALILFVFRLHQVFNLVKSNNLEKHSGFTIVILKQTNSAFSFFNFIFLGELISDKEKETVLTHEKIHVKEKHSIDLIWFELLKILFWFNPLVYFYQIRIKEVHEFIADEKAQTKHNSSYRSVLLNQLFQSKNLSFVNPFYKKSLIKNRLTM